MKIIGLYQAKVKRIGPKHELTGIYKYPVESALVNTLGLENDIQVDKRYHGGPARALHQYAHSSYEKIIKAYPLMHKTAWPGSMGENISVPVMNEHNVCIGDIYQMGNVKVQVSGPRMPCFKIAAKFRCPGLNNFVAKHAIHGWYYRVLEGGVIARHDNVALLDRPNPEVTVTKFLEVVQKKTSDANAIHQAAYAAYLDPEWKAKLEKYSSNAN